jgi:hypothetical protein
MSMLHLKNVRKVECETAFPPIASSVRMKISEITPKDSAVLIYTPAVADNPIRFDGPEAEADVAVAGHEMHAQPILGCQDYKIEILGGLTHLLECLSCRDPKSDGTTPQPMRAPCVAGRI